MASIFAEAVNAAKAASKNNISLTPCGDKVRSALVDNPDVSDIKMRTITIVCSDGTTLRNQRVAFSTPRGTRRILPSQLGVGKGTTIEGKTFYVWGMI